MSGPATPSAPDARWSARVLALGLQLAARTPIPERDIARGEIWLLLNAALQRYLRFQAAKTGAVSEQDREDIAAEKALDLLCRCEQGKWDLTGRTPAEVAGFLARVARNGLMDHYRRCGREVDPDLEGADLWERQAPGTEAGPPPTTGGAESPAAAVEGEQYIAALKLCAGQMQERERRIWFFRVFYEMRTRDIAAHPEIRLNPGHVDVLLQRCREAMRRCMARRGFEPRDLPTGAFTALWRAFRAEIAAFTTPQRVEEIEDE